jgi:serine/threonine protein phosphatase PrpC
MVCLDQGLPGKQSAWNIGRPTSMHQPAGYWQAFIDYAELSDVGLRRANNQDSSAVMLAGNESDFFRRGHLFVVADGMGRHAAGELASKIAVDTVPLEYFKQPRRRRRWR